MSSVSRKRIIALTGTPGVGKTTLTKKLIELLQKQDVKCDGFYTQELRENGQRVGFDVITLDGKQGPLARISQGKSIPNQKYVGKYAVDVKAFDNLVLPLLKNMTGKNVIIIDEIGKMELFSKKFEAAVRNILVDANVLLLTTIPLPGNSKISLVEQVRSHPECLLVQVTHENRSDETLQHKITDMLKTK